MYGMGMDRIWVWVEGQSIVWVDNEYDEAESSKHGGVIVAP